jgi:hypothetical protein
MSNPELRRNFDKMSSAEKMLFQDGFVSQFVQMVRGSPDRRNILNQIGANSLARERLTMALGPQRKNELEAFLRVEELMDKARGAVSGNSTTARQLVELGLAGGVGGAGLDMYQTGHVDPTHVMLGVLAGALAHGGRVVGGHIDERVAQRVAKLLTSGNLADYDKGIRLLATNKRLFSALRGADLATRGAVQGAQAGGQRRGPRVTVTDN